MSQQWSLAPPAESQKKKGWITHGRAYYKTRRTTIFLARILDYAKKQRKTPEDRFGLFMTCLLDTEIHEQIHIFFDSVLNEYRRSEKKTNRATELLFAPVVDIVAKDYSIAYNDVLEALCSDDPVSRIQQWW